MDIEASTISIQEFIGHKKDFKEYKSNKILKRAVERELEIIGEAMNRILKIDPTIGIENSKRIVSTRNYIIHAYDSVQDEIIWGIIINNIPSLQKEVTFILASR